MNKKGFTLVELLAVIIILSVLALLASTSVTKVVRDSKTDLYNTQIELIKAAAEAWGADNLYKLPDAGACKYIKLSDLQDYGLVDSNVKNPKTGKEFDKNLLIKITGTENRFGLNNITYEVESENVEGCESIYSQVCTLVSGEPNEIGSKYECEVKPGTKYTFYVLSKEDNGTTNLIMERNICEDGSLATEENTCIVAWNLSGAITEGPVTAMDYLQAATSNWTNANLITIDTFESYDFSKSYLGTSKMTKTYNTYARLPYFSEVSNVSNTTIYLIDYLDGEDDYWLPVIGRNAVSGLLGYFTFAAAPSDRHTVPSFLWIVHNYGILDSFTVTATMGNVGVRPVINMKL